jgi:hypothetical protein
MINEDEYRENLHTGVNMMLLARDKRKPVYLLRNVSLFMSASKKDVCHICVWICPVSWFSETPYFITQYPFMTSHSYSLLNAQCRRY